MNLKRWIRNSQMYQWIQILQGLQTLQSVLSKGSGFCIRYSGKPLKGFKQGHENDLLLLCSALEQSSQGTGRTNQVAVKVGKLGKAQGRNGDRNGKLCNVCWKNTQQLLIYYM